jgi:hypothetical protein
MKKGGAMLYKYRNTITGIEFESNCVCVGSDLERLEPRVPIEEKKEVETPKKPAKRGVKK